MRIEPSPIPADWLTERVGSWDVIDAHRASLLLAGLEAELVERLLARGLSARSRAAWDELVGRAMPGDELWHFRSPRSTWDQLGGRAGFALVRAGAPIAAMITALS